MDQQRQAIASEPTATRRRGMQRGRHSIAASGRGPSRAWSWALGPAALGLPCTALASYGQMNLDVTPLVIAVGVAFGAALGIAEIIYARADIKSGWRRLSAGVTAALVVLMPIMLMIQGQDARVQGFFAISLGLLLWLPPLSHRLPLQPWQRLVLLCAPALGVLWYAAETPRDQAGWFWYLGASLAAWACLTVWAGPGECREARLREQPPLVKRPASAAALRRMDLFFAAWDALVGNFAQLRSAGRGAIGALSRSTGLLSRGTLVFMLCYAVGAAIVALGLPVASALLLSLASRVPGADAAPFDSGPAALIYWLSYGFLPTLAITALGWPFWRNRDPR